MVRAWGSASNLCLRAWWDPPLQASPLGSLGWGRLFFAMDISGACGAVQRPGQEDGGGGVVWEGSYRELNAVNKTWAERKEAETQQEGPFPH